LRLAFISPGWTGYLQNCNLSERGGKNVPDDLLLIETDAPYLTPETAPRQAQRTRIRRAYRETSGRAARGHIRRYRSLTTLNAKRLFGIGTLPEAKLHTDPGFALSEHYKPCCTSACTFCARFQNRFVKGHNLMLDREPTAEELICEIGDPKRYREIVFCGYGEPLLRLDVVKIVAAWVKQREVRCGSIRTGRKSHSPAKHSAGTAWADRYRIRQSECAGCRKPYERISSRHLLMHTLE
jgi:TatD DNase family protein